jgi:hypothetical protein
MSKDKCPAESDSDDMTASLTPEDSLFAFVGYRPGTQSEFSRKQDWYFYINGYKDAADLLVAHAKEGDPRKLRYPVLFLYRQHLELALKALICDCCRLVGLQETFPKTHRIDELWSICCSLIDDISPGTSSNEDIRQTTRLMEEFCKIDPKSEAFRYPEDKSGNTPVIDAEMVLSTVKTIIGKMSLLLDCMSTHISTLEHDDF